MSLFIPPVVRATDANNVILPGAKLYFYLTGTTTPATTYTTSAQNVAHPNPVVADSSGLFPPIYLNAAVAYRAILKTAAGVTIRDVDPYQTAVSELRDILVSTSGADFVNTTDGSSVQDQLNKIGTKNEGVLPAGTSTPDIRTKNATGDSGGTTDWRSITEIVNYSGSYGAANVNLRNTQHRLLHSAGTIGGAVGWQGYSALGVESTVTTTGGVGTLEGIQYHISHTGSGAVTNAFVFSARGVDMNVGVGTLAKFHAFHSDDIASGSGSRLQTEGFGFFQANCTAIGGSALLASYGSELSYGTNRWDFYLSGGASSWHAGRMRIGGTAAVAPTDFMEVVGGIKAHTLNTVIANIGYGTSAGGTVTQATSKSTGVTLDKPCGQITMNNASLASNTSVSFTLTNNTIAATDVIVVNIASGATADSYAATVTAVAAGSCRIQIRNVSGGALGEALVLNFAKIAAVAA